MRSKKGSKPQNHGFVSVEWFLHRLKITKERFHGYARSGMVSAKCPSIWLSSMISQWGKWLPAGPVDETSSSSASSSSFFTFCHVLRKIFERESRTFSQKTNSNFSHFAAKKERSYSTTANSSSSFGVLLQQQKVIQIIKLYTKQTKNHDRSWCWRK